MHIHRFAERPICGLWILFLGLAPCLSAPFEPSAVPDLKTELAAHVQFLTQPKLKGRGTRTAGAKMARRYIEDRFQACGLLPWGAEKQYELAFGLGKNVVGILPGSDPDLAAEIVLLSAHYDHLGKGRKGKIHPGAADNASGVAVLLEAVQQLSRAAVHPKRTIAFASFDGEEQMLLGSFAFSCRPDVEHAKIVGVVNVDMLGRNFLDTLTNTVFVAGTEGYPDLQQRVRGFGAEAGIRILPLGTDLIGPRSDHVAFESRDIPCLFFSCGTCRDYHGPTDTAEKLNYADVQHSLDVILRSVVELANGSGNRTTKGSSCDPAELESVRTVVNELSQAPEKAGIKAKDIEKLHRLQSKIEGLLANHTYDRDTRERLIIEASGSLLPYLLPFGESESKDNESWMAAVPYLEHIYLNYHRELMAGQKQLIRELVKQPPSIFRGFPPFKYEVYGIRDDEISVLPTASGVFSLHAVANKVVLETQNRKLIWPFKAFGFNLSGTMEPFDCVGSREQLTDLCLLRLHAEATNALHTQNVRKILRAVHGTDPQGDYSDWLKVRLKQSGHTQETDWLLSCMSSPSLELAREAIGAADQFKDPRICGVARGLFLDRKTWADSRAEAMELAIKHPNKTTLLALVEVLDDASPIYRYTPLLRPDYPLTNSMTVQTVRPLVDKMAAQPAKTIGQMALGHLKKLTKKNFGSDAQKWKAWIRNSWRA